MLQSPSEFAMNSLRTRQPDLRSHAHVRRLESSIMNDVAAAEESAAQPSREPGPLRLGGCEFAPGQPLVMAIVNRTPDSFYRPGLTWDEEAALERVHSVVAEGADILDIGGGAAQPGPVVRGGGE